jgi:hypothetical protein
MLVQDNPTPAAGFRISPRRPARRPTVGLLTEVTVLQHETLPVLHWLSEIGATGGG